MRNETPLGHAFRFRGEDFIARPSGALWWPGRGMLVVSDLHLGRSERYARRGGPLLPPWEVADTLDRLEAEITALNAKAIVSLGDSFDDDRAASCLAQEAKARLGDLAQGRDWFWITGNHDRSAPGTGFSGHGTTCLPGYITLRHEAGQEPDISGHLHPVVRLAGRRWRCFVLGPDHLILPAFGTYTGGLDISDPVFTPLAHGGIAIACSPGMFTVPIPFRASRAGRELPRPGRV